MATETLEPHLVEALRTSAWEVLETMVFMTPSSVDPIEEGKTSFSDEVIGVLGFTGTKSGSFVVRTKEKVARTMAAKMLMMEPEELGDFEEVADAFGEVVNMLSGNFKNAWVSNGNQMELAVPHVVRNGNVNLSSDSQDAMRSGIRVALDEDSVEIGVHFEC